MPGKITDEEKLPKIPNLDVAQWKFYLKSHPNCEKTQTSILKEIKEKGNYQLFIDAVFYRLI